MDKNLVMNKLKEYAEKVQKQYPNYKVGYVALKGSQNYNLETENSDVDCVVVLVPNRETAFLNERWLSSDLEVNMSVKDVREYVKQLKKGSPSLVETLVTDYYLMYDNYFSLLREKANEVVQTYLTKLALNSYYMSFNTYKDYLKTHNQKALSHAFRMMAMYFDCLKHKENFNLKDSMQLKGEKREEVLNYKTGVKTLTAKQEMNYLNDYNLVRPDKDRLQPDKEKVKQVEKFLNEWLMLVLD